MIDIKTKNNILKFVKIEDIISDFMKLTPRGDNFVAFCPFDKEKMMTFRIDTSNNTYRCSTCGKSGSSIDFLMEILNINYNEALQYIAKKYNITLSPSADERSNAMTLFEINRLSCEYYEKQLTNSDEGQNIALSYYKQSRGFSDDTIQKFRLGYSPSRANNTIISELLTKGYTEDQIIASGIGVKPDEHSCYDRFHERITFPVMNLSGEIVAFSCRTMRSDVPAKYKNTNETPIYTKGNEMYGLYQAKQSILDLDHCILVEGNADVVMMHQAGFTQTVASLGTGFTENQAYVLHRFTNNITLLFDGDAAGIHANEVALSHFLPLGVIPKIVLLPEGADPDSFVRNNTFEEASKYLNEHAINFVQFYLTTRLEGAPYDPIKIAQVTKEIIQKIALIPSNISRSQYAKECKNLLSKLSPGITEASIIRDIQKEVAVIKEEQFNRLKQMAVAPQGNTRSSTLSTSMLSSLISPAKQTSELIVSKERKIMRYIAKYGMVSFSLTEEASICLIEYIISEFKTNELTITHPIYRRIIALANTLIPEFESDLKEFELQLADKEQESFNEGIKAIQEKNLTLDEIQYEENMLKANIENQAYKDTLDYRKSYLENYLCSHPDKDIRTASLELITEPYTLSRIHTQHANIPTEFDNLAYLVQDAINNLRFEVLNDKIATLQNELRNISDAETITEKMTTMVELMNHRSILARYLGERVLNPKK